MGISRMTVIRKADAGELPCIVINRGTRQKMRRFPRAAIEQLAAGGIASGQADLKEYTACWLADVAARIGPPGVEAESARRVQVLMLPEDAQRWSQLIKIGAGAGSDPARS